MASEELYRRTGVYENKRDIKGFIGLLLITVGILMVFWVFMNVYTMFTHPQELEVFKQLVPDDPELRSLDMDDRKIIIPIVIFHFMAYGSSCLLLLTAGIISSALVTGGVHLLQSDFQKLEEKIEDLKNKIDEIKEIATSKK